MMLLGMCMSPLHLLMQSVRPAGQEATYGITIAAARGCTPRTLSLPAAMCNQMVWERCMPGY